MICPHSKTECSHYKRKTIKKDSDPRIRWFFEEYEKHWPFNGKPIFSFGRDSKLIKAILSQHSDQMITVLISKYFYTDDMFIKNNGYDVPRFIKFVQAQSTGGYGAAPSISREIKKAQDELIQALMRHHRMPDLSPNCKKLFYSLNIKWSELESKLAKLLYLNLPPENIFLSKPEQPDFKKSCGGDNGESLS